MYLVVMHGSEPAISKELADVLREAAARGVRLVLAQDDRYAPFEGYEAFGFEEVVYVKIKPDFAAARNAVLKKVPEGEWTLWLDFDEYLSKGFFDKVASYLDAKRAWLYRLVRINIIEPEEKVEELLARYGWYYQKIDLPECGTVKAINFPDYQTRLVLSGRARWYGKVHEIAVAENKFKEKVLPIGAGYILHRKSYEKQVRDNANWETY